MIKEITSKENNKIKHASSLKESKYRKEYQEFLVEGKKSLEIALISKNVKEIFTTKPLDNIPNDITQYLINEDLLKKICFSKNPEGVAFICNIVERKPKKLNKVVYLDHLNDPGNVGTIIRTALAFDYDAVMVSEGCCDIYNEKVIAASKGAIFSLPIFQDDLEKYQGKSSIIVSALNDKAISLDDIQISIPFILVVGNEANGVSQKTLSLANIVVKIDIQNIDSLNVAVASGILMNKLR